MINKQNTQIEKKTILCKNMLMYETCKYGNKCIFAHGLSDQHVFITRQKAYALIKRKGDMSNINLLEDKELYNGLLQLTRLCFLCFNKKCQGGYNCKNGAISKEYVVCYNDLQFGNCINLNCDKIHLTKFGLINFKLQEFKKNNPNYKQQIIKNNSICIENNYTIKQKTNDEQKIESVITNLIINNKINENNKKENDELSDISDDSIDMKSNDYDNNDSTMNEIIISLQP